MQEQYRMGYDDGYAKGREGEMIERSKYFQMDRETVKLFVHYMNYQYISYSKELVRTALADMSRFLGETEAIRSSIHPERVMGAQVE